jgi:hypothetical protein
MTRVSAGMRRCPNCGRDLAYPAASEGVETPALAPPRVPPVEGKPEAAARESAPRGSSTPPAKPAFSVRPADIRALVVATPELIEPGLRVYAGRGSAAGGSFPTAVGEIDLLAQDDAGGLVVVMVAEGEPDKEAVLELLERIGFVRTRVARSGQEVRGLLLAERLPEPTRYAVAALGGTVSVKSWRVALTFDDLRV